MSALGRVGTPSAWEAEALPLDDTRKMLGSHRSTVESPKTSHFAGVV
jgi:hypothetical protein